MAVVEKLLANKASVALNVAMSVPSYKANRKNGDSVLKSVGKVGIDMAAMELLGPAYWGVMGIQMGVSLGTAAAQNTTAQMRKAYNQVGKFGSGHFSMTDAGYTMRQRSLNAIRSNGMNIQSALGNEARQYVR